MFGLFGLLKNCVKEAMHAGVDEWASEVGLPATVRQMIKDHREACSDTADIQKDVERLQSVYTPEDYEVQKLEDRLACPPPDHGDDALLDWVGQMRDRNFSWQAIAKAANNHGHKFTVDALRLRFQRREKRNVVDAEVTTAANSPVNKAERS